MKILVTGASGFIGGALIHFLAELGHQVVAVSRHNIGRQHKNIVYILVNDLIDISSNAANFKCIDVVIHLAGRAHIIKENLKEQNELNRVNVLLTDLLASQSLSSGVKRFIYMSTIKVNGDETKPGEKYKSNDIPDPKDVYAISKYHAELKLQEICKNSSLEYVIIRPPLVYGGGVKANFLRLVKLVKLGIPLPFGSINNKRSFICLENLIDFIVLCLDNPKAKNKVFLVSDGDDVSTCDLLVLIAEALNVNLRLFNIKQNTLEIISSVLGFRKQISRLTTSLQVDIEPSKDLLGWLPKYRMKDQLGWLVNQSEQNDQKNI